MDVLLRQLLGLVLSRVMDLCCHFLYDNIFLWETA